MGLAMGVIKRIELTEAERADYRDRGCGRIVMCASEGPDGRGDRVAVVFEVGDQVVIGVAPAVGADAGDLAAADRVPERKQDAQLVADPLHPAVVVDDRATPLARYDRVDGHGL